MNASADLSPVVMDLLLIGATLLILLAIPLLSLLFERILRRNSR